MNYSTITEKDLEKRYDYLPPKIKTLFDGTDLNLKLNKICEDNHIADESKKIITFQLVGMVLLGILHIDDLAAEIDKYLSLNNYKFSKAFAEEITKKIFEPVRAEIEKNYRPLTTGSAQTLKTESGTAAVKMTPAPVAPEKKPVPLGQLESKDALVKPLTPPNFSPTPKPGLPSFKPAMPPQPKPSAPVAAQSLQSKNPPVDLSQKSEEIRLRYDRNTMETQSKFNKDTAMPVPQPKPVEMKKEAVAPESVLFGIGDQMKLFDKAQNELVDVLKKREETAPAKPMDSQPKAPIATQPIPAPSTLQKQRPVMIHQETATQPIRPNVDFKLNFPQAKPTMNFDQKTAAPKMATIEVGGTTEKQLEGMVKSPVIQPPKVVHYNAFQTPMDRPTENRDTVDTQSKLNRNTVEVQSPAPLSQSPFVQTGKGLGDMRLEQNPSGKFANDPKPNIPAAPKIKTVDFSQENEVLNQSVGQPKVKRGWFSRLFGKKDKEGDTVETQSRYNGNAVINQGGLGQAMPTPPRPVMPPVQPTPLPQKLAVGPMSPNQFSKPMPPPPAPPKPIQPNSTTINPQNLKNFAPIQSQSATPKTQDVKPLNPMPAPNNDGVVDLNTFQIKR